MIKVLSLFCGVGGFDLGFKLAGGYSIEAATDYDYQLTSTYRFNFSETKLLVRDIKSIDSKILNLKTRPDVIIGGSPCQGFSMAGSRNPEDPRNTLIFDYQRIVLGYQPRIFVFENVPGFLQPRNKEIFQNWLKRWKGYYISSHFLNSKYFGLPQDRERLFIIGCKGQIVKDIPEEIPPGVIEKRFVCESLFDLGINGGWHKTTDHSYFTKELFKRMSQGDINDRRIKLVWDGIAPTVTTKQRLIHPIYNRYLTPRECARLQGFPDNFLLNSITSIAQRQVGNALSVNVSYAIAMELKKYFKI